MTPRQFAAAIDKLGCSRNQAPELLGVGRSSVYNYLKGEQPVPPVVKKLIELLLKHGVPKEWKS